MKTEKSKVVVIIKKGENVNHAGFDDVKKNLLDNECHHQKEDVSQGENVNVCIHDFDDAKKESNKAATFALRLMQDFFNKQILASRFLQDQALPQNKGFQSHARLW
ncbi:hypothetical protein GmHk_03G006861 [Glycine max]|nr:hypothetical protein GmHk_03G006861 [Glycine max]